MAEAKRDNNYIPSLLAVSNVDSTTPVAVEADPTTKRLLVSATVSGLSVSANTEYTEGDTDTTFTGIISMAEGPSNTATPLQVDASKHLQVDIAADSVGIGGGTQYTEGDTDASITGTAILWEDTSDTLTTIKASKPLPIGDAGGSLTVDGTVAVSSVGGTVAVTQSGTWDEVGINDSGNSITVDDGGTTLSIDDGSGSITVDGTITANAGSGTFVTKEVRSSTPSQSSVAGSASSVSILSSNANRLGATISNDSTAALYLKLGTTASTSSYTIKLLQDDYYEVPFGYTGAIDGIWASATGNARITELTA